jgi:uncharacterized protein YidB (DUF937 family)
MGMLDDLENRAANSMLGSSSNPLATGLLHMIQNQPGGLSGLVQCFHDKGLGGLAASWVGTGQNLPITADQIQNVLGNDRVKELAAKAGISPDMAGTALSQLLPALVDKLTPNGQVPQHASVLESCMSMLQSFNKKTGTDG